jgi:hypothetical protein
MELINATRMTAGYTMGLEPSGRELLLVVVKGTFVLPLSGEQARLHDDQLPLVMADTFTGEAGSSAPEYEADFAQRKSACDVLLLGSAYAPEGRPTTRTEVALNVGSMIKRIGVVGSRFWDAGLGGIRATPPQEFVQQPISYDVAFGGLDVESDNPAEHDAYRPNPVGLGFRRHLKNAWIKGRPLPHTEEPGRSVAWPADKYRPMAFGPVGRGWVGRCEYAGTYDQLWRENRFPFLPHDFDERYFQAAPSDQQIAPPTEPTEVCLVNLTPDGQRRFVLPHFDAPVHVFPRRGGHRLYQAVLDTIVFEPDLHRFTLTWRITHPLRHNLLEISQVLVGKKSPAWWRARESGKRYSESLPVTSRSGAAYFAET